MGTWLVAPVFPTGDMAEDMVAALWHCPVPSPLVFGEQVAPGSSCCHLSPPMGCWPTLLLQHCLFCSPAPVLIPSDLLWSPEM